MRQHNNLIHTLKSYNLYTTFRFYMMLSALARNYHIGYSHQDNVSTHKMLNNYLKKEDIQKEIQLYIKDYGHLSTKKIIKFFQHAKDVYRINNVHYLTLI